LRKRVLAVPPLVKTAVCVAAHVTGLSRVIAVRYRGRGTIFGLHSVVDDGDCYLDETLRCPVAELEGTLRWLQKAGVEFVSLDEAVERLHSPPTRLFAAFTFDDGFADNLTHALPVMERFGAPFTVYVATGMITRELDAWWFALDAWIRSQESIELPYLGRRFECPDRASKKRTFKLIEAAIQNDSSVLPHLWMAIRHSGLDGGAILNREALDEEQLRILARHPLVTIGGHTTTHANLKLLSAAKVEWEMTSNRKFLQDIIGKPVEHFAYPFGDTSACGLREAEIARSVGFRTAVTTRHGAIFPEHIHHLYALPRVHLACDDTPSTLRCKIDGVYHAVQSRLGSPIACM
jgi:peptidoglycan/xylan/chitin deacetylase (PgdA/CDA1 family)